jgi:hypothetical protein
MTALNLRGGEVAGSGGCGVDAALDALAAVDVPVRCVRAGRLSALLLLLLLCFRHLDGCLGSGSESQAGYDRVAKGR